MRNLQNDDPPPELSRWSLKRWLTARRDRRAKRRDYREMGVCPDCGIYLGAHKAFGHGRSRYL